MIRDAAPRTVVLMGCNTGVYDDRAEHGGFSLATAFLAAGTEVVVASTRDIDGAEASVLGQGLYAELGGRDIGEPGEWFRRAVWWAKRNGRPELAMGDYRVLVR